MLNRLQEEESTDSRATAEGHRWPWFRRAERAAPVASEIQNEAEPSETSTVATPSALLQQAITRRNKAMRRSHLGAGIIVAGLVVGRLGMLQVERPGSALPCFLIALGMVLGGDALMVVSMLWGERACRRAVRELASSDDLHAIGPLAEALTLWDPSRSLAVSTLIRLLPHLQPADAAFLSPTQLACLRRALRQSSNRALFWRYDPHFAAVLQRALTAIDALPEIEQTAAPDAASQHAAHASAHLEALQHQFQEAVRQRQKNTTMLGATAGLAALSSVGNLVLQGLLHTQGNTPLLGVAIGSMALTLTATFRGLFRLKAMMNELANTGDLRVVGPLIEIAALQEGSGAGTATLLLARLLPRLKASDATLLTEEQQEALGQSLLRHTGNPGYLIAALAALEQIGDGRALPTVEVLAAGRIKTEDPQRVQTAARECLPYLQMRYESRQASRTLLRASALSETSSGTLLRPVQGVVPTEQSELLRPGTPRLETESDSPRHDIVLPSAAHTSFAASAI